MKQFVILGGGRFGSSLAIKLMDLGAEVMLVDKSADIINKYADRVTYAIQADVTDEKSVRSLGIRNFDTAVVTIGDDIQSSILVTLMIKEMGMANIVAKAQNETHAKVLFKIGADRVVFPEKEMGIKVAKNLMSAGFMDFLELSADYSIVEIVPPEAWLNRTIVDLDLRERFGFNILAIKKGAETKISILPDDILEQGDILVVVGANTELERIGNGEQ